MTPKIQFNFPQKQKTFNDLDPEEVLQPQRALLSLLFSANNVINTSKGKNKTSKNVNEGVALCRRIT